MESVRPMRQYRGVAAFGAVAAAALIAPAVARADCQQSMSRIPSGMLAPAKPRIVRTVAKARPATTHIRKAVAPHRTPAAHPVRRIAAAGPPHRPAAPHRVRVASQPPTLAMAAEAAATPAAYALIRTTICENGPTATEPRLAMLRAPGLGAAPEAPLAEAVSTGNGAGAAPGVFTFPTVGGGGGGGGGVLLPPGPPVTSTPTTPVQPPGPPVTTTPVTQPPVTGPPPVTPPGPPVTVIPPDVPPTFPPPIFPPPGNPPLTPPPGPPPGPPVGPPPGPIPEPASWLLMIAGFGIAGAGLRRRRANSPAR